MTVPKWLLPCLLTLLCWGGWAVVYKVLGDTMSAAQAQAFSTLGILPLVFVLAATPGRLTGTHKLRGSAYALASGVLSGLGNLAYYLAIEAGGKASTAASLSAVYPMTTVVLGMLLLHEKPRRLQVAGIAGSLGAVYLFNVGEGQAGEVFSPWLVYALAPIFLWGSAALLQKLSTEDISAELATCWFLAAFVPIAVVILATRPIRWSLSADAWLLVAALGAHRNQGKASIVTPLSGLYPLVAIPLAVLVLGEQVVPREWAGIALALAAALALSYEKSSAPGTELATAHEVPLSTGS